METFIEVFRISKLFDKMNTYSWTESMEEGCLALGRRAEYRTDKDLYHIIRLQKIIENIETLAREKGPEAEAKDAYIHVRTQLEEFRAFLSVNVSDSRQSHLPKYRLCPDPSRPFIHAISHRQAVPIPGCFLRT